MPFRSRRPLGCCDQGSVDGLLRSPILPVKASILFGNLLAQQQKWRLAQARRLDSELSGQGRFYDDFRGPWGRVQANAVLRDYR